MALHSRAHHETSPTELAASVRLAAQDVDAAAHRRFPHRRRHVSSELIHLALSEHPLVEKTEIWRDERGTVRVSHSLRSGDQSVTVLHPDNRITAAGQLVVGLSGAEGDVVHHVGEVHPTSLLHNTAEVLRDAARLVTRYSAGVTIQPQL